MTRGPRRLSAALAAALLCLGAGEASAGQDPADGDAEIFGRDDFAAGASYLYNFKYAYHSYQLHFRTPRFVHRRRGRIEFTYEATRATEHFIGEYNRLLFLGDYLLALPPRGAVRHGVSLDGGLAVVHDMTDAYFSSGGWYVNPRFGAEYLLQLGPVHFSGGAALSIFRDGMWLETEVGAAWRFLSFMELQLAVRPVISWTYEGEARVGSFLKLTLGFVI